MTDRDTDLPNELDTLRVVAMTIGENAVTEDDLTVARILLNLLLRLERAEKKLN